MNPTKLAVLNADTRALEGVLAWLVIDCAHTHTDTPPLRHCFLRKHASFKVRSAISVPACLCVCADIAARIAAAKCANATQQL